jgi:hypothetical protein
MHLANNQALCEYLTQLEQVLMTRHATELAKAIAHAIGNFGSLNTEFLGEANIALQLVSVQSEMVLDFAEIADLKDVLKQVTAAFVRFPQTYRATR